MFACVSIVSGSSLSPAHHHVSARALVGGKGASRLRQTRKNEPCTTDEHYSYLLASLRSHRSPVVSHPRTDISSDRPIPYHKTCTVCPGNPSPWHNLGPRCWLRQQGNEKKRYAFKIQIANVFRSKNEWNIMRNKAEPLIVCKSL